MGAQQGAEVSEPLEGRLGAERGDSSLHGAMFGDQGVDSGRRAEFREDGGKELQFLEFEVVD
ncbi:hypothetical protein OY671_009999, partial [Metschnikowia pulcherrima]